MTTPQQLNFFVNRVVRYANILENEPITIDYGDDTTLIIDISRLSVSTVLKIIELAVRYLEFTGWAKSDSGTLTIFYK